MVVVGAGAMGSLIGALLTAAVHAQPVARVTLVDAWRENVAALRVGGLHLQRAADRGAPSATGSTDAQPDAIVPSAERRHIRPVAVVENALDGQPAAVQTAHDGLYPIHAAVMLVKADALAHAIRTIRTALDSRALVVAMQNGIGHQETVAKELAAAGTLADSHDVAVTQAVITLGARLHRCGDVRHTGIAAGRITFGIPQPCRPHHERLLALLVGLLRSQGVPCDMDPSVERVAWAKLVANAAINALTALFRVPNGALDRVPELRQLVFAIVTECVQVANARGISLPDAVRADPTAYVLAIARATAANRSSMLQDLERGRATEIDYINGAVVRLARENRIAVPLNDTIVRLVHAATALARSERPP